jgi:hypothetical protein
MKISQAIVFASAASATDVSRTCQSDGPVEVCINKFNGESRFVVINYRKDGVLLEGTFSQVNAWYKINAVEGIKFNMGYWGDRGYYLGATTGVDITNEPKFDIQVAFFADNKWDSKFTQNYRFQFE